MAIGYGGVKSVKKIAKLQFDGAKYLYQHGCAKTSRSPLGKQSNASAKLQSGAGAALDRAVRAIGIDVQRTRSTLNHFARDDHLFDTFQAGQAEHGLEQNAFQDRTQADAQVLTALDYCGRQREDLSRLRRLFL